LFKVGDYIQITPPDSSRTTGRCSCPYEDCTVISISTHRNVALKDVILRRSYCYICGAVYENTEERPYEDWEARVCCVIEE